MIKSRYSPSSPARFAPHPVRAFPRENGLPARRQDAGFSLVELLVAMAVAMIILSSVIAAFVMILRLAQESRILLNAAANARAGLRTLSDDIKQASFAGGRAFFVSENNPLGFGNGIDDDQDGEIDEEEPDGRDNDGDWDPLTPSHAAIGSRMERPNYANRPDWGDRGIDEDVRFHRDRIAMRVAPIGETRFDFKDVFYEVTSFEGQDGVLMRLETTYRAPSLAIETTYSPLAYDVLSFNCLYWNSNELPATQYWLESWYSFDPKFAPGFELPSSVLSEITVYADPKPIESYRPGQPVRSVTIRTITNIETVIQDLGFPRDP